MSYMRLGDFLIQNRKITKMQLERALQEQTNFGNKLGKILVDLGMISEAELLESIAEIRGLKFVDLSQVKPSSTALNIVSKKFCLDHMIYPIRVKQDHSKNILYVALEDSFNLNLLDELKFHTGIQRVEPVLATDNAIMAAIRRDYEHQNIEVPPISYEKKATFFNEEEAEELYTVDMIDEDDVPSVSKQPAKDTMSEKIAIQMTTFEADIDMIQEELDQYKAYSQRLEKRLMSLIKLLMKKGIVYKDELLSEIQGK